MVRVVPSGDLQIFILNAVDLRGITVAVAADNQVLMANEGAIESLIGLLVVNNDLVQRQSAKALANLGVNADNKPKIAAAGGIPKLIALAGNSAIPVKIEAIAALANLAVNGTKHILINCRVAFPLMAPS
jgi:hypothetical protein